jgi:DNA-binding NarL/FixJ family response regulator
MRSPLEDGPMRIQLFLACRDSSVALALCKSVSSASRGQITGHVVDLSKLVDEAMVGHPDVIILEHVSHQEERTWLLLAQLGRFCPYARVLLFCEICKDDTINRAIRRGARGCVLKSIAPSLLAKAVKLVRDGDVWFGRAALFEAARTHMLAAPERTVMSIGAQKALTQREREVLALAGNAMSNKEIARVLNISDKTVKTHLHKIYVKLQKSGRYKVFLPDSAGAETAHAAMPGRLQ